jgi:ornithine cyclodeaminase/alanine dehydrogenase-like protein (mu-crystallin family)
MAHGTLVLSRSEVAGLLPMAACIRVVERAFMRHARGQTIAPGVLGTSVEAGGFHIKSAGLLDELDGKPIFAAKVNANFPGTPTATTFRPFRVSSPSSTPSTGACWL